MQVHSDLLQVHSGHLINVLNSCSVTNLAFTLVLNSNLHQLYYQIN